jgi:hypothetical protein
LNSTGTGNYSSADGERHASRHRSDSGRSEKRAATQRGRVRLTTFRL